jgi:hypothetical protein
MDKRPLIRVSIVAVVLLVLSPLSNVVGYQSVKSTVMNDSPLFRTRTLRANNQQQYITTAQYLGKGKNSDFFSLARNETIAFAVEEIKRIKAMSETTFALFVAYVVQQIHQHNKFRNVDEKTIVTGLYQLRQNPISLKEFAQRNTPNLTWLATPTACWFPGCFVMMLIFTIMMILLEILTFTMLC